MDSGLNRKSCRKLNVANNIFHLDINIKIVKWFGIFRKVFIFNLKLPKR